MRPYSDELDEVGGQNRKVLMNILGKKIKRMRLEKHLTQEWVAEKAGCNPKYLGEIEAGKKTPGSLLLNQIAQALDVSVCSLLSEKQCSCVDGKAAARVTSLLSGRGEREVKKAVRLIEVLFDVKDLS